MTLQRSAGGVSREAPAAMGRVEWLLLVTLSVLWGGSFFFSKVALEELPPLTIVLVRVVIAASALHIVLLARGMRMPRPSRRWGAYLAMGALNNAIPFSLIFWGQTQIASGLASILNATTPIFTVILAHILTREERISPGRAAGVLLGMSGVAVMIGIEAVQGLSLHVVGELAVVGAAISYALASLFGRRLRGEPPLVSATGQLTASALIMLPVALLVDQPWSLPAPGLVTLGALVSLALLSTALAYVIYFRILTVAGATNLMLVTFLIPVSALLLGTLILNERLDVRHIAGMLLIACGLLAMDGRPVTALRQMRVSTRRAGSTASVEMPE